MSPLKPTTPNSRRTARGMSRGTVHAIWFTMLGILVVMALASYHYASIAHDSIDQSRLDLDGVYRELDNARRLSASLAELDRQTINENTATRLEILRHLGLEQSNYDVNINSRQEQQIGPNMLYLRTVHIVAELPYQAAMAFVDNIHNTGRLVLSFIRLENDTGNTHAVTGQVRLSLDGTLYGLQKKNSTPPGAGK